MPNSVITTVGGSAVLDPEYLQAKRSSVQAIPNNTTTAMEYSTVVSDANGNYNATTSTYTVPADGIYLISAHMAYDGGSSNSGYGMISILRNGIPNTFVADVSFTDGTGEHPRPQVSGSIELDAGDTIQVGSFQNTGSTNNAFAEGCFSITRLTGTTTGGGTTPTVCPSFKMIRAAGQQAIPNSAYTNLTFDTISHDNLSGASLATMDYTVQEAGVYLIYANVMTDGTTGVGGSDVAILVNGAVVAESVTGNGTTFSGSQNSDLLDLAVGDVVTVQLFQDSGTAVNTFLPTTSPFVRFGGHKVCDT